MKTYLTLQLSLLLSIASFGQHDLNITKTSGVGFEAQLRVSTGQTLYSIARATGQDVDVLMKQNGKSSTHLDIDETLYVDINFNNVLLTQPNNGDYVGLFYTVGAGDNLYQLAQRSNLSTVQILELNQKSSSNLAINEKLLLGWLQWSGSSSPIEINHSIVIAPINRVINIEPLFFIMPMPSVPKKDLLTMDIHEQVVQEKGIAYWDKEASTNKELVVMHPSAPINSEITLYNPMLKRKVNAIVVGEFSKQSYANDISVVISPSVANALGALDKRFLVEITYSE